MSFSNQSITAFAHDYETTGLDIMTLGVVQSALCIATVHQDGSYEILDRDVTLLNPGEKISAEASAIHGYTDFDVMDKPAWEAYLRGQMATVNDLSCDAVISFNGNRFDNRIAGRVGLQPLRSVDLYKAAAKFKKEQGWEKANLGYSYQKLVGKPLEGAHDAFADIQATLDMILPAMQLAGAESLDDFCLWMKGDGGTPEMKIGFGKHKGSKLRNLPKDYISWLLNKSDMGLDPDLKDGLEACV
ncbi:DNA polymerase III subunit epsilon [compost metagenome]